MEVLGEKEKVERIHTRPDTGLTLGQGMHPHQNGVSAAAGKCTHLPTLILVRERTVLKIQSAQQLEIPTSGAF